MRTLTCFVLVCTLGFVSVGCGGESEHPRIGQNGVLSEEGNAAAVLTAIDRDSYDELFKDIVAHDLIGVQQLITAGKVLQVKKGPKVLVIDVSLASTRVRILDGEYSGKAVWVPFEVVMRTDNRTAIQK